MHHAVVWHLDVKIGKQTIGEGRPVFIAAEIASAHGGEIEICKSLVERVSKTGADAIKFQKFSCDELAVPTWRGYDDLKKIELTEDEWGEIIRYAKKFDWEILADVFDERSCDLMDNLGAAAFKIHSTDLSNPYLISYVAKNHKPILLGVGGATLEEIRGAANIIKSAGNDDIILIHGFQSYPTQVPDTNLRLIQTLKNTFGLNVGYHDHVNAESELAIILPSAAVALGASVIEKHITPNRSLRGYDYHSALNPDEFERMVKNIREVEKSFGSGTHEFSAAEKEYRETVRKNIVARIDMPPGTSISPNMLAFKRSKPGLPPSEAEKIIGKKTKVYIKKDEIITRDKLL